MLRYYILDHSDGPTDQHGRPWSQAASSAKNHTDTYTDMHTHTLDQSNACMALYSPFSSLTPLKARLKQIMLQHKVDTEKDLFYDLRLHMCVSGQSFKPFGSWTLPSVGLACFFYSTNYVAVSKRFFMVELPTVIKARLTTIWAAKRGELKRQLIHNFTM